MKKTSRTKLSESAESIARQADDGQDVSSHFTNKGKMMSPLDDEIGLGRTLLDELDQAAKQLKVTRQALIKQFIRRGLDEQHRSPRQRKVG